MFVFRDLTRLQDETTWFSTSFHGGERSQMLILTRRVGETVMVGNDVTVTVLGVKGNQVRVGINAPLNVAVHREEIYERIKREQQGEPSGETEQTSEFAA